jgi:hypothetical protein
MQILLGCCKAKYGREDKSKSITGKDRMVWIHQTLEKNCEYKGAGQQLFIEFKKTDYLFRIKVLTNILIEFGINMKLVIEIKMYLNESYTKVRVRKISWYISY